MEEKIFDLLEKIVDDGLKKGTEYVESRYQLNTSTNLLMRQNKPIGLGKSLEQGVAIRVIVDGALGFSSTTRTDYDSLKKSLETAISIAKASSTRYEKPIRFTEERMGKASVKVIVKKPATEEALDELIKYTKDVHEHSQSAVSKVKIAALFQSISFSKEEKYIVNSDGGQVSSIIPRVSYFYNMAIVGENGSMLNRWYDYSAVGGLELLKEWDVIRKLPEEAKALEKTLVEGKTLSPRKTDVVIGNEIVGLMVHESSGHPSEADRILGREAAQAGLSFIKKDSIGKRIGNDLVTIIDDPTIPGSNGFYLYDDEGVPARKRFLYKDGLINEFLHNRWTASVFGTKSNAAARSVDYKSEPIVRMANTYFMPRDYTFDELVEDIKEGVFLKSYMEWNIDDERWTQRYVGLEAYYVEKGEIKYPLKNPVLETTTGEIYNKIDAVGKKLYFHAGTCGKGEPSQPIPVWFGGPDIRVRGVWIR